MKHQKTNVIILTLLSLFLVSTVYAQTLHVYNNAGINEATWVGRSLDNGVEKWNYYAQTFVTPSSGMNLTHIGLPLSKHSSGGNEAGNLVVQIREVDANGKPTDTVLTQGNIHSSGLTRSGDIYDVSTMNWFDIEINKYTLSGSTIYAIVCQAPECESGAEAFYWWADTTYSEYQDGKAWFTFNETSWFSGGEEWDYGFELWEYAALRVPTLIDANMIIGLMFCLGMGAVGYGMAKGKDSTPALFLMLVGFVVFWQVGYFPSWIPIVAIAFLGILLANKLKGVVSR